MATGNAPIDASREGADAAATRHGFHHTEEPRIVDEKMQQAGADAFVELELAGERAVREFTESTARDLRANLGGERRLQQPGESGAVAILELAAERREIPVRRDGSAARQLDDRRHDA